MPSPREQGVESCAANFKTNRNSIGPRRVTAIASAGGEGAAGCTGSGGYFMPDNRSSLLLARLGVSLYRRGFFRIYGNALIFILCDLDPKKQRKELIWKEEH